jgi:hypothetical protein
MFCSKCGMESPDDSQFCRKCGNSLASFPAPPIVAPVPAKQPPVRLSFILTLLLMFAVFGWFIDHSIHHLRLVPNTVIGREVQNVDSNMPQQPQPHSIRIGQGALTVGARYFAFYTLAVPAGAHNIKVHGHFQATGGGENDIEVLLLSDEGFINFKNGHGTPTYYNSGKVTVGDVQAGLPDGGGTYYLVFNNAYSTFTPKAVQFDGTMVFYQ